MILQKTAFLIAGLLFANIANADINFCGNGDGGSYTDFSYYVGYYGEQIQNSLVLQESQVDFSGKTGIKNNATLQAYAKDNLQSVQRSLDELCKRNPKATSAELNTLCLNECAKTNGRVEQVLASCKASCSVTSNHVSSIAKIQKELAACKDKFEKEASQPQPASSKPSASSQSNPRGSK